MILSFYDLAKFSFASKFDFILGHRSIQDSVENIFSQIRNKKGKMRLTDKHLSAIKIYANLNLYLMYNIRIISVIRTYF